MPPLDQLIAAYKKTGWNDVAAIKADIAAGHWQDKWNNANAAPAPSNSSTSSQSYSAPSAPPAPSAQQTVDDIIKAQQAQIDRETSFLDKYTKDNPFIFDEALAKASATAEYSPYYSELLNNYLQDVGVNRDSLQSEDKLLRALTSTPTGTAGAAERAYQRAVDTARQGFAEKGTLFSGTAKRALGSAAVEQNAQVGTQATDIFRKATDVTRQQDVAVAGGVQQRQQEAMKGYYAPLEQSYFRQFPTDTGNNVLSGYVPSDYLRL